MEKKRAEGLERDLSVGVNVERIVNLGRRKRKDLWVRESDFAINGQLLYEYFGLWLSMFLCSPERQRRTKHGVIRRVKVSSFCYITTGVQGYKDKQLN